jgi:hypothetical protein
MSVPPSSRDEESLYRDYRVKKPLPYARFATASRLVATTYDRWATGPLLFLRFQLALGLGSSTSVRASCVTLLACPRS